MALALVSLLMTWLCLKLSLILSLARGVPGEGPDCHFPKEIVGFGPDSGPNPGICNFFFWP